MFDLHGKRALITGASGGIGKAIAKALHKQGANVLLAGRRKEVLEELLKEFSERAYYIVSDLEDLKSAEITLECAKSTIQDIDILVNNAGLTRDNLCLRMKDEEWQTVIDVNLTAAFRLSRAVVRSMMKSRWGRIINITSVVGSVGNSGQSNYAASKAGVMGMSKALAAEVATRGITVNCIAPGLIKTPMTSTLNSDQTEKLMYSIPAGRFGEPEDVAACAVFLASEEAAYVTGQTLHVNGGMAMI